MKKFFGNNIFRSIVQIFLPIVYTSLFALWVDQSKKIFLIISIILLIIHIILTITFGRFDSKQKKEYNSIQTNNKITEKHKNLFQQYATIIEDNADKLYEMVREKKGHSDIKDWTWVRLQGDKICGAVYLFIKEIAQKGDKFAVSIILKMVENGEEGYTMSSRESDDAAHKPQMYRNFIKKENVKNCFYSKIIEDNVTRPRILMNKKEIEHNFDDTCDIEYSQYIALPILCKGKSIGILQICAYGESVISTEKSVVENICHNYLSVASNEVLLVDKCENISQLF